MLNAPSRGFVKVGKVPAFLFHTNSRVWDLQAQQHQTVEKLEIKQGYDSPQIETFLYELTDMLASSPLEDPEKGDDWDWD